MLALQRGVLAAMLLLFGAAHASEVLQVATSIPPQAYLIERIGGARVKVEIMVPPGSSHEAYAPAPRQMVALTRAQVFFAVGHPAFNIEAQRLRPFLRDYPAVQVIEMFADAKLIPAVSGGHNDHDGQGETDPHLWLSLETMRAAAGRVATALAQIDPDGWDGYFARRDDVLRQIDALQREFEVLFRAIPHRRFFVYHAAWGYFAAQFGLEQVAMQQGERAPTAERFAQLVRQAREEGVKTIFVEKGETDKAARVLAREINATVVELDPLAYDWPTNMRTVAQALAQELRR